MLCCYTKQTIIKTTKMIVIKSNMKEKKDRPIKVDQIGKVVDRCFFFVCLNWAFANPYTYPLLTLFDTQLLPNLKQNSNLNQSLKNIPLCCVDGEKHGTFYLF